MAGSGYYAAGRPGSSAQDRGAVPWGIDADTPLPKLPGYDFKDPRARAQKIAAFAYLSRTSGAPKFKFCHPRALIWGPQELARPLSQKLNYKHGFAGIFEARAPASAPTRLFHRSTALVPNSPAPRRLLPSARQPEPRPVAPRPRSAAPGHAAAGQYAHDAAPPVGARPMTGRGPVRATNPAPAWVAYDSQAC